MIDRMKRAAGALAFLIFVAGAAFAQDKKDEEKEKAKQEEKAAEEKIKEFKATKIRSSNDTITALEKLGEMQHPKIMKYLFGYLGNGGGEVRRESARQLAKYKKSLEAANALIDAATKGKNEVETSVKFIECVGDIGARPCVKALHRLFDHKELDISQAAIDACGAIKSRDSIVPLLSLAKELEAVREDDRSSSGSGSGSGGPELPGPSGGSGMGKGAEDRQLQRKNRLLKPAIQALKDITGGKERYGKAEEWEKWWAKNKDKFKEVEE